MPNDDTRTLEITYQITLSRLTAAKLILGEGFTGDECDELNAAIVEGRHKGIVRVGYAPIEEQSICSCALCQGWSALNAPSRFIMHHVGANDNG